jgi:hypothetical protein
VFTNDDNSQMLSKDYCFLNVCNERLMCFVLICIMLFELIRINCVSENTY